MSYVVWYPDWSICFRRDHESEKKDLRKRESSGDARRRKRDETEEERKIRKG